MSRLTHTREYADKRKNKEPMLKIRNKLFFYENIEEKHNIRSLDDLDRRLKALEIIKEKNVNVGAIIYYLKMEVTDAQVCHWYNDFVIDVDEEPERILNEEDVVCLKEVLL